MEIHRTPVEHPSALNRTPRPLSGSAFEDIPRNPPSCFLFTFLSFLLLLFFLSFVFSFAMSGSFLSGCSQLPRDTRRSGKIKMKKCRRAKAQRQKEMCG